jgi:serine protease Do
MRDKIIQRGYFGAEFLLSEKVVRKMGQQTAVLITRIDQISPAAKAGLRAGDLIVGVGNAELKDSGELHRLLERSRPDDDLALHIVRNNQYSVINVRLGMAPVKKEAISNIGTGDQAEKLGLILRENSQGIEVTVSYAMAKTIGFNPNDRIVRINGTPVKSIKELNGQLMQLKENDIALVGIQRNGNETFTLPIGTKTAIKGYTTLN